MRIRCRPLSTPCPARRARTTVRTGCRVDGARQATRDAGCAVATLNHRSVASQNRTAASRTQPGAEADHASTSESSVECPGRTPSAKSVWRRAQPSALPVSQRVGDAPQMRSSERASRHGLSYRASHSPSPMAKPTSFLTGASTVCCSPPSLPTNTSSTPAAGSSDQSGSSDHRI